jgi:flagellar assembly protein FliH
MPSLHNPDVSALELPDLSKVGTHVVPAPPSEPAPFHPSDLPVPAPIFELVGSGGGVPDEVLAPARAAAQAAGYAAGWAHGVRAARLVSDAEAHVAAANRERAEAERAAEVRRALSALDTAATALERSAAPSAHEIEQLIVSSALTIAEALIADALRDDEIRGRAALTRALSLAPSGEDVTVALSPADHAIVSADGTGHTDIGRTITLVADATLAPGDALAHCGATTIDARLSTGLARVRAALGAGPSGSETASDEAASSEAVPENATETGTR